MQPLQIGFLICIWFQIRWLSSNAPCLSTFPKFGVTKKKDRQPILSVYSSMIITLFEPKKGHVQLFITLFPTPKGQNMSLKILLFILWLFMNTSRILCTFKYQKGHKMYTASNWCTRHTNCQTDSTTLMAFCQNWFHHWASYYQVFLWRW